MNTEIQEEARMKTAGQGHRGQKCDTRRKRTGITGSPERVSRGTKTNWDRSVSWMSDIKLEIQNGMTFLGRSQHLLDEETGLYNIKTDKNRK